jgi:outer membrane lipoprotein-sorting protein
MTMLSILRSRRARWAVPAVTVAAVGAAIGVGAIADASSPDLPEKTAGELLVAVTGAEQPFSGTVVQTSRLGLPELPSSATAAAGPLALLTGSHTARIWYTSTDLARVAVMDQLDETNIIRDGDDVWMWSSETNTAQHAVLPAHDDQERDMPNVGMNPADAAAALLAAVDSSTEVVVDGTATVAGRAAYELVVTPRDDRSLIEDIRLAVDGATSMPLRVQVNSGADEPAFEVGFTSVTFGEPSADVYRFNPPPGATVEELDLTTMGMPERAGWSPYPGPATARPQFTVVGEAWTAVLVVPDVILPPSDEDGVLDAVLGGASQVSGPYGSGRLLETELVSVLLLDDGRLLAGAVEPDVLFDAAADTAS